MPAPATDEVLYDVEGTGVAWLVLNRPDAGNAVTPQQRGHILELLERAGADLEVRVVVLTATGERHFCTGADLRVARPEPRRPPGAPDVPAGTVMRGLESQLGAQRLMTAVQDCPKPVIAAVNGTAAGIGAHLAFACDLVIPDGGGPYLVTRLVGPQKAKELFFFGDDVPAEEARRMGLVNAVVPAGELRDRARQWAERLAQGPTVAIALTKRLVNAAMESDRGEAFRAEALAVEVNVQSADGKEGVQAFVARRPAHFVGW